MKQNRKESKSTDVVGSLSRLFAQEMREVDRLLGLRMEARVPIVSEIARHLVVGRGKRIRALLTLASARLCGVEGAPACELAAVVEMIHAATLLHDDVLDQANERRGRDSARRIWGDKASILAGDFLFGCSFRVMVSVGHLEILHLLADTSVQISEGEILQLKLARKFAVEEEERRQIVKAKASSLFSAACQIGPLLAGKESERKSLESFGLAFGEVFQLRDDLLDYLAPHVLNKVEGHDFYDGHVTIPTLWAFREADAQGKAFWKRTIEEGNYQPGDWEKVTQLMRLAQVSKKASLRAQEITTKAKEALSCFPATPLRDALEDLVLSCARDIEKADDL